jgi:hypothetical protein|tara:strand:+ start:54 stop:506 length:453 start_codon:yes stop_codon:yes gene_type:complete
MWLEHIRNLIKETQTKTPDNFENHLNLNCDIPFAIFMIKLLEPKFDFMYDSIEDRYICNFNGNGKYEPFTKEMGVKIRFYLQKTILDETSAEFYADVSNDQVYTADIKEMFEILNIIVEKINTSEKFDILCDSIFDIMRYQLYFLGKVRS